jgi:hypothetical protein
MRHSLYAGMTKWNESGRKGLVTHYTGMEPYYCPSVRSSLFDSTEQGWNV